MIHMSVIEGEQYVYYIVVGRGAVSECFNNPNHYLGTNNSVWTLDSLFLKIHTSNLTQIQYTFQTYPLSLTKNIHVLTFPLYPIDSSPWPPTLRPGDAPNDGFVKPKKTARVPKPFSHFHIPTHNNMTLSPNHLLLPSLGNHRLYIYI